MEQILEFLNTLVREVHGNRLQVNDLWIKSSLDTFGTVWVFATMNEKYGTYDSKWLDSINLHTITVQELISRAI